MEENYSYWKSIMHIYVNSLDKDMCDTITQNNVNGVVTSKSEALWNNNDKKNSLNLINCLNALGNLISNEIATNKVVRYLTRNWKPKVIVIKEANNLATLDLTTLFGI